MCLSLDELILSWLETMEIRFSFFFSLLDKREKDSILLFSWVKICFSVCKLIKVVYRGCVKWFRCSGVRKRGEVDGGKITANWFPCSFVSILDILHFSYIYCVNPSAGFSQFWFYCFWLVQFGKIQFCGGNWIKLQSFFSCKSILLRAMSNFIMFRNGEMFTRVKVQDSFFF